MIISNSEEFIFIHIPKCGGSTVSRILNSRLRAQDVTLNLNPHQGWGKYLELFQDRYGLVKHSTGQEIAKAVGADHFKKYYPFVFSRNPYSRAFSAFTFTKSADAKYRPDSPRYQDIKDMSFKDFLNSKYMRQQKIFQARPQIQWVEKTPIKVEVLRLENFEAEMTGLFKRLGGAPFDSSQVVILNSSAPPSAWKSMTSEEAEIVRELYRDDFEYFEYSTKID